MLNEKPIFVNSFARGGSNIVWEILQSHPDAAAPIGETDKIIWEMAGSNKSMVNFWLSLQAGYPFPRVEKDGPYWLMNYGFFSALNHKERNLNTFSKRYLDKLLYDWKLRNLDHPYNKYKTEDTIYTLDELKEARVVAKHVNGMVFLVPTLMETYRDSVHFGLVRNGLALCESRLRRKTFTDAGKFGIIYRKIVDKFLDYQERYPNFHIITFEDMLAQPVEFIKDIYGKSGLSFDENQKVRLKAKKFVNSKGQHESKFVENSKHWVSLSDFHNFVDSDINENQINGMSAADKDKFLKYAGKSMEKLGYL